MAGALGELGHRVAQEGRHTVDMFHRLEQQQHVERLAVVQGSLRLAVPAVDRQAAGARMQPRRGDVLRSGIDTDDLRAAGGQRLAHQAGAATDVDDAQPLQRADLTPEAPCDLLEHVAEPQFVDDMQRPHRPTGRSAWAQAGGVAEAPGCAIEQADRSAARVAAAAAVATACATCCPERCCFSGASSTSTSFAPLPTPDVVTWKGRRSCT